MRSSYLRKAAWRKERKGELQGLKDHTEEGKSALEAGECQIHVAEQPARLPEQ